MVPTPLLLERLCLLSFYYSIGRNTPPLSAPRGMVISYHDVAHEVFSEESKKEVWTSPPPSPQNILPSFEWPPTCVGSGSGAGRGWLLSHLSPETREWRQFWALGHLCITEDRGQGKSQEYLGFLVLLFQEIKGGWGLWVGICLLVSLNFCLTVIEKHWNQVWLCVGRHA